MFVFFRQVDNSINDIICNMKLCKYRESGKRVTIYERSTLFGFTNLDAAEIPRIEKSASTAAKLPLQWRG